MSKFKENIKKHNRIVELVKAHGLSTCTGTVIDEQMPKVCFRTVCDLDDVVATDGDFLKANPVIADHIQNRQAKIDAFKTEQAEAHAWNNRTI